MNVSEVISSALMQICPRLDSQVEGSWDAVPREEDELRMFSFIFISFSCRVAFKAAHLKVPPVWTMRRTMCLSQKSAAGTPHSGR